MIGLCLTGTSPLGVEVLNRLTSEFTCSFSCPAAYPNIPNRVMEGHLWTEIPYHVDLTATGDEYVYQVQTRGVKLTSYTCLLSYKRQTPFELLNIEEIAQHHRYNFEYPLQTLLNLTEHNLIKLDAPVVFLVEPPKDKRSNIPYLSSVSSLSATLNVLQKHSDFFAPLNISFHSVPAGGTEFDAVTENLVRLIRPSEAADERESSLL